MSDALTDIARDDKLEQKCIDIGSLEEQFKKNPSPKLAEEIISKFNELLVMPRGYWKSVNTMNIKEKRNKYITYLKS